jgi:hypothetical protein
LKVSSITTILFALELEIKAYNPLGVQIFTGLGADTIFSNKVVLP